MIRMRRPSAAIIVFIASLSLLSACSNKPSEMHGSSNANSTPDLKKKLLGHWVSEDGKFDYYFSPSVLTMEGEAVEGEGHSQSRVFYSVIQTDPENRSITLHFDLGLSSKTTGKYTFREENAVDVEMFKDGIKTNSYKCLYVSDKMEP